jgi:uncharacterized protein YhfF
VDGLRALELGTPGDLRAELNGLVLDGRKRATAGLLAEYAEEQEELEHVGERLALEEWRDRHRRYWAAQGTQVDDDTEVVLIRFDLLS